MPHGQAITELGYSQITATATLPGSRGALTGAPLSLSQVEVDGLGQVLVVRFYCGNLTTNAAIGTATLDIGDITTVAAPGTQLAASIFTNPAAAAAALPILVEARYIPAVQGFRSFQVNGTLATLTATIPATATVPAFLQALSYGG